MQKKVDGWNPTYLPLVLAGQCQGFLLKHGSWHHFPRFSSMDVQVFFILKMNQTVDLFTPNVVVISLISMFCSCSLRMTCFIWTDILLWISFDKKLEHERTSNDLRMIFSFFVKYLNDLPLLPDISRFKAPDSSCLISGCEHVKSYDDQKRAPSSC